MRRLGRCALVIVGYFGLSAVANSNADDSSGIFSSVSEDQWKTGFIGVD